MINRTQAPAIHDAISFEFNLPLSHKDVCNNNVPFYWLQAGTQEVAEVCWVFKAGIWEEPQTAVAQTAAALLKNGTTNRNAFEISEAIEYYGASLGVSANNDYTTIKLHSLSKYLPQLLPVVKDIIINACFPEDEVNMYKQKALQRLSVNLMQCDFVANRQIDAMVFGKAYPYGKFTEVSDIEHLNAASLRAFHSRFYAAQNCTMFLSGNFDEEIVDLVKNMFGQEDWNSNASDNLTDTNLTKQPASRKKERITNDAKGVQGAIRIAKPFFKVTDPEFAEAIVLNTLFGGYFGSRLMANIREDKGFTYGIYSSLLSYKHDGEMMIATEAGNTVCEQAVAEIYKEMRLLQQERVPDEELLLVKNYLLGSILGDLDGPFSIMQRWKNLILNGQTEEHFYRNINIYKNISPERIQELAQLYLNPEDFYELVVV